MSLTKQINIIMYVSRLKKNTFLKKSHILLGTQNRQSKYKNGHLIQVDNFCCLAKFIASLSQNAGINKSGSAVDLLADWCFEKQTRQRTISTCSNGH
jgi:hypothetical protein